MLAMTAAAGPLMPLMPTPVPGSDAEVMSHDSASAAATSQLTTTASTKAIGARQAWRLVTAGPPPGAGGSPAPGARRRQAAAGAKHSTGARSPAGPASTTDRAR